jgi:hypothetical protein
MIPIGHTKVERDLPGANTKWIVVKQVDGSQSTLKVFLRQDERFREFDGPAFAQNQKTNHAAISVLAAEQRPY